MHHSTQEPGFFTGNINGGREITFGISWEDVVVRKCENLTLDLNCTALFESADKRTETFPRGLLSPIGSIEIRGVVHWECDPMPFTATLNAHAPKVALAGNSSLASQSFFRQVLHVGFYFSRYLSPAGRNP